MIALRTVDVRNDFKRVSEIVKGGEPVLITRPHNDNLVVLSERDYNELERARSSMQVRLDEQELARREAAVESGESRLISREQFWENVEKAGF